MSSRADADELTEQPRVPLSRRRVLRAAVRLADRDGLESLTMRRLAQEVGVEAMSLYHHVANKEAVLDGVVEVVLDEIMTAVEETEAPPPSGTGGRRCARGSSPPGTSSSATAGPRNCSAPAAP